MNDASNILRFPDHSQYFTFKYGVVFSRKSCGCECLNPVDGIQHFSEYLPVFRQPNFPVVSFGLRCESTEQLLDYETMFGIKN